VFACEGTLRPTPVVEQKMHGLLKHAQHLSVGNISKSKLETENLKHKPQT
jgi:hypothetical protein